MSAKERKILTLTVASLAVAVVTFGILQSSGQVTNNAYSFGGAFAGFVFAFLLMLRAWGPDTFTEQALKSGASIVYEEIVKTLDLRQASPLAARQHALLNDYYRAIKSDKDHRFHLHYGTTGDEIRFEGSASHPTTAQFRPAEVDHEGPQGQTLKHQYDLDIPLTEVAPGQVITITAEFTYINAFRGQPEEWLETHVDKPTGRLAMIVLMPDGMLATDAHVITKKEGRDKSARPPEPIIMHNRSVIYWSVSNPDRDVRYALGWNWQRRDTLVGDPAPLRQAVDGS